MSQEQEASAARPDLDDEQTTKPEEPAKLAQPTKPMEPYVLVRHTGRSALTRTTRALRSGHRRKGVLLDDGTRIRKKGKKRLTAVTLSTFVGNNQRLLEYVRVGQIEVCDAETESALSYDELVERIAELAGGKDKLDERSRYELIRGPVLDMESAPAAPAAPAEEPPAEEPPVEEPPAEEPPAEEEGKTYSEDELLAMNLEPLKTLAVEEFGLNEGDVKKLRAKKDVVALIMEADASEDEE